MEKKLLLAIGLMVGLMVLSNVIFPPAPTTAPDGALADSAAALPDSTAGLLDAANATPGLTPAEPEAVAGVADLTPQAAGGESPVDVEGLSDPAAVGRRVTVRSSLYEYQFDTEGARLVGTALTAFPNFAPDRESDGPVELLRPNDSMLGYRIATGSDTVSLTNLVFETSAQDIDVPADGAELRFSAPVGAAGVTFEIAYRFSPTDYRIDIEGGLRNVGDQGYTVLVDLGRGLRSNEANPREDFGQMAVVTRTRTGTIAAEGVGRLDPGEAEFVSGGPFNWVASKSKYFLTAVVSDEDGSGFGGVLLTGVEEEDASQVLVALPVPAGSGGFEMIAYVGPQDVERLEAIGQELQSMNPYGWKFLQWFIRPFGAVVIDVLTWMHTAFSLSYGWVLILFGVLARVVLFPLYQMSMRSQMKQTALQPEIKKIQEKYKEDPPKLQQEMMKAYKEAGVSPVGGCLPMLVPFPILITLFFVFQNTIEFRGVPFLWLPDLSLKDPLYIVPFLMGGSMLLLNWIGQRGMETNQQMKMMTYALPVVFTFMFAQFAAGLNLYYASSNIASLPQQLYLSKERRQQQAKAKQGGAGGGSPGAPSKPKGADTPKQTPIGGQKNKGKGKRKGR